MQGTQINGGVSNSGSNSNYVVTGEENPKRNVLYWEIRIFSYM